MYLKRLRITNIKGFREVDLDFTRPDGSCAGWTVIAGRNGSGKSTLLKVIALAVTGPSTGRRLVDSFSGWIRESQEEASAEVEIRPREEDLFSRDRRSENLFWGGIKIHSKGDVESPEPVLVEHRKLIERGKKVPEKGPWADNASGWFICGYGPFRRLTGHTYDALGLMASPYHVGRLTSLFREDASLIESIQWLKEIYTRSLEKRPEAVEMMRLVLMLIDDGLLPDGMTVERFDSDGLWVRQHGTTLPLRALSDGYRNVVALVLDLVSKLQDCYDQLPIASVDGHCVIELPGIVLIDEIDAHLHVGWQQRVGFWLKSRFPKVQFIVATHSPFICHAADSNGLIRLPGPGDEGQVEQVPEEVYYTVVNGTIDDAVVTELFGLDHPYSEAAGSLRARVTELEAKDLQKEISETEVAELWDLRQRLPGGQVGR
jgi:energy-coupling factor transporter ATP-binding protein EcfA2